jgi:glutamate synthase (NADPH/NADH) small chain
MTCAPPNGMKVGVVGAGPAGITIAIRLARKGYKVTVFEGREKIGGILRYGIPEFRLPKSILDRYYRRMRDMGILFRPNFSLGGSTSIQDLLNDGYRSVFVGTGAWKPRKLGVPGETFGHVFYAINYLNNPDVYELGDRVAIIGAGNAAMDVARTAIRHGSKDVTIYVRGDQVAASENEYDFAKLDGVHFEFRKSIVRIVDEGAVFCDQVEDPETGKLVEDHSTDALVEADSIMISISQVPRDRLVMRDHDLHLNEHGTLQIDSQGETTMEGVFASGDVVTGAKTVVAAVALSKQIADNMDRYMQEKYGNKEA